MRTARRDVGARTEFVIVEPAPVYHGAIRALGFGPMAARRLETAEWRGYALRVPPLDLQLAVTERRGLAERAAGIRAVLNDRDRRGVSGAIL